jgi:isocitrate dehydrogenase
MTQPTPITVAYGDGIGPEIMEATLRILQEAGAKLNIETIEVGEQVYKTGNTTGISADAWESLRRTKVFLKAPITTPQGGGYKSLNVTIRKTLGLYANIRPCMSYHPFVETKHPKMNVVVVRENEEDIYAGIEYRQTADTACAIKLITKSGSERIMRHAFEYAVKNGRKKVTCMSKDNIMKFADGLFHEAFRNVGKEYPQIEQEHYIVDIGTARIANKPEIFDVVVTENLYGDVISDVTAEISGSVGLAGSSNLGRNFAMFEAIHGSAPDITGQGIANPSGLINGAVMMLNHICQGKVAAKVQNALLATIENGIHTSDIYREGISKKKVSTQEFADAVIEHLGQTPKQFPISDFPDEEVCEIAPHTPTIDPSPKVKKEFVGADIFVGFNGDVDDLADQVQALDTEKFELGIISSKGLKVWPNSMPIANPTDLYRLRFYSKDAVLTDLGGLMNTIIDAGIQFGKCEVLYHFNGERAFSLAQGE